MKNLVVIALALFTLTGVAQEKRKKHLDRKDGSELRKEMTSSEIAGLKAKKLTLKLDLSDAQQNKVNKLYLSQAESNEAIRLKHKAMDGEKREKPSKEEFVKMQNHRLDQQIKMKREMKSILTAEQYAKFEKMKPRRQHRKKGMHKVKE